MIKQNKVKIIMIFVLMFISIGALTYSFGYVSKNDAIERESYFYVSEIKVGVEEKSDSINLGQTIPMLDRFGILNEQFTFSVTNNGEENENYLLKLIDGDVVSTIPNNAIRYELSVNGNIEGIYDLSNSGLIKTGIIKSKEKLDFGIRIWLNYDSDINAGVWKKVISATAGNVNIDNSGANSPIIDDGMIPVYYDDDKEVWCKADEENTSKEYSWYDYDAHMWANVVTVNDETRNKYMDASLGTEIEMEDITSMWVWIPRFKYTLFEESSDAKEIKIAFEKGLKTTGSVTCNDILNDVDSETCIDNKNKDIVNGVSTYTHPAFNYGNEKLEGIWVSKFEAGVLDSKCSKENNAINCNSVQNIYIKPGIFSLNYISMYNLFQSFNKMNNNKLYGFNDSDVHMIKNSEWGAVAYLAFSQYGKFGNSEYTNKEKNIYQNPNKNLTGYSNGNSDKEYFYNVNKLGTGASTTGNVYGIYDLAGGRGEIIMINFSDSNEKYNIIKLTGNSEFNPNKNYYDTYAKQNSINGMKLGDATKETNWFNSTQRIDYNNLIYRDNIFSISHIGVMTNASIGSRPVIKISSKNYITSVK